MSAQCAIDVIAPDQVVVTPTSTTVRVTPALDAARVTTIPTVVRVIPASTAVNVFVNMSDPLSANIHAPTHQHGGVDEVATAIPAANAIPKADGAGLLDDWISNASETVRGIIELATQAEVDAGTDAVRAVTPATLKNSANFTKVTSVTTDTVLTCTVLLEVVLADTTAGDVTLTLPTAIGNGGCQFAIKKTDATANGNVIVQTAFGQTIDGLSSNTIKKLNESIEVVSDGANWFIIG